MTSYQEVCDLNEELKPLIERYYQGDKSVVTTIHQKLTPITRRAINQSLGHIANRFVSVEDLEQESFLKLVEVLDGKSFEQNGYPFSVYWSTCLHNFLYSMKANRSWKYKDRESLGNRDVPLEDENLKEYDDQEELEHVRKTFTTWINSWKVNNKVRDNRPLYIAILDKILNGREEVGAQRLLGEKFGVTQGYVCICEQYLRTQIQNELGYQEED